MLAGLAFCEMLSQYPRSACQGFCWSPEGSAAVCDPNPPRPFAWYRDWCDSKGKRALPQRGSTVLPSDTLTSLAVWFEAIKIPYMPFQEHKAWLKGRADEILMNLSNPICVSPQLSPSVSGPRALGEKTRDQKGRRQEPLNKEGTEKKNRNKKDKIFFLLLAFSSFCWGSLSDPHLVLFWDPLSDHYNTIYTFPSSDKMTYAQTWRVGFTISPRVFTGF